MRVFLCGDRKWTDEHLVDETIKRLKAKYPKLQVYVADGKGVDIFAGESCVKHKVKCVRWEADWGTYSRNAGNVRNKQMFEEGKPDMVVAFHDHLEDSKAVAAVIRMAQKYGVPVYRVQHKAEEVAISAKTQPAMVKA